MSDVILRCLRPGAIVPVDIETTAELVRHIAALEQQLAEQRQINSFITEAARKESIRAGDLERDAARWCALIGSARIRPLGCAGIKEPEARNYAHLGLELWTVFGGSLNDEQRERLAKENALGREWLTAYADIAAATVYQEAARATPETSPSTAL